MTQSVFMFPSAWLNLDKFLPDYSFMISLFLGHQLEKTSNCKSFFAPLRYKPPSLLIILQPRNTLYYFSTGLAPVLKDSSNACFIRVKFYLSTCSQLNILSSLCLFNSSGAMFLWQAHHQQFSEHQDKERIQNNSREKLKNDQYSKFLVRVTTYCKTKEKFF